MSASIHINDIETEENLDRPDKEGSKSREALRDVYRYIYIYKGVVRDLAIFRKLIPASGIPNRPPAI